MKPRGGLKLTSNKTVEVPTSYIDIKFTGFNREKYFLTYILRLCIKENID